MKKSIGILVLVFVQLLLVMSLAPSNSYLIKLFTIEQIGIVSADEEIPPMNCCPETCQDVLSTNPEECAVALAETTCEYTNNCKKGCCIDEIQGSCDLGVPRKICEERGGVWKQGSDCLIQECQKGCCVLGNKFKFKNEKECEYLSQVKGIDKDFRDIETEYECISLGSGEQEGACVYEENACRFKTKKQCIREGGSFYKDIFCSNPILETGYEKGHHQGCANGEIHIYNFDNYNNKESIYKKCTQGKSACELIDGNPICKDLSCEYNGKTYLNGESWCVYEGFIGDGKDVVGSEHWLAHCLNGEFEIDRCGEQRNFICSEHVIKEGNKKFSTASCVVNEASRCMGYGPLQEVQGEGENAKLVDNQENINSCQANSHCKVEDVYVDQYFQFKTCVPAYPKGANLRDEIDDSLCAIANQECIVTYLKKNRLDDWDCEANCNCEKPVFAEKMNNLCVSLGDCGSYVNYIGEGTNNIKVEHEKKSTSIFELFNKIQETKCQEYCEGNKLIDPFKGIEIPTTIFMIFKNQLFFKCARSGYCENGKYFAKSFEKVQLGGFEKYADSVEGQFVKPQNINRQGFIWEAGSTSAGPSDLEYGNKKALKLLGKIVGGTGTLIGALSIITPSITSTVIGTNTIMMKSAAIFGTGSAPGSVAITIGAIGTAALGAAIGMFVGHKLAQWFGVADPVAATVITLTGGASGAFAILAKIGIFGSWTPAIVLVALTFLFSFILGGAETKEYKVSFKCLAWTAPGGGEDCSRCHENDLFPCTRYKCESLGQTCEILNENTDHPICEAMEYETDPPIIIPGNILTPGYDFTNKQTKSVKITKQGGGCVQEFTKLKFTLNTNEAAQCKFSFERPSSPDYEEMVENFPLEENLFTINHSFEIKGISVDSLDPYDVEGNVKDGFFGDVKIYVRCKDGQKPANFNIDEYIVNFCLHDGPDETVVDHSLTVFKPKNNDYLKYGETETDFKMWINEPAECKYDLVAGTDYNAMPYSFGCKIQLDDQEDFGWPCNTTLTDLFQGENNFYIKCKDKPWESEDLNRNKNKDDFPYTLHVSESELSIDSVEIKYETQSINMGETIKEGFEPVSVEMSVETSGGADNGEAICYWTRDLNVPLQETNSNIHTQFLADKMAGNYNFPIKCEDKAGNTVYKDISFTIEVDFTGPRIVRAYNYLGELKLITDELAQCYYNDYDRCNPFNFENSTKMTIGFSNEHFADWNTKKTYYVKCGDAWDNVNSDCAIIIKPST